MSIFQQWLRGLTFFACLVNVTPTDAARIKEDPNGFNQHTWGESLGQSLKLIKDLGSTDFVTTAGAYENPGEALNLNGVAIKAVRYRFIDERLESIHLRYIGRDNRERLMGWLEERYGRLTSSERKMINSVQWFGDKTTVTLTYNQATQEGSVWFTSQALNHLFNEFNQGSQGD